MARKPKDPFASMTAEQMFGAPVAAPGVAVPAPSSNSKIVKSEKSHLFTKDTPTAFKPGQSGNPKGRPTSSTEMKQKAASKTDLALELLSLAAELELAALKEAAEMLRAPKGTHTPEELKEARRVVSKEGLAAAKELLDRGHGKSQQKVEVSAGDVFSEMTPEQQDQYIIDQGAKVVAEIAKRKGK